MIHVSKFSDGVYKVVKKIPNGQVLTYKQVAIKLGDRNLARAVGNVLNKNRDKTVSCHRVIRSDGRVGGYNRGTRKKIRMLKREGVVIENEKVIK